MCVCFLTFLPASNNQKFISYPAHINRTLKEGRTFKDSKILEEFYFYPRHLLKKFDKTSISKAKFLSFVKKGDVHYQKWRDLVRSMSPYLQLKKNDFEVIFNYLFDNLMDKTDSEVQAILWNIINSKQLSGSNKTDRHTSFYSKRLPGIPEKPIQDTPSSLKTFLNNRSNSSSFHLDYEECSTTSSLTIDAAISSSSSSDSLSEASLRAQILRSS